MKRAKPKPAAVESSREYPEGSGIRLAEIPNRNAGQVYGVSYQIRVPAKLAGRREVHQRKTKAEAERLAEDRFLALKEHGKRFSDLPSKVQEEAALAWSKFLKDAGIGFLDAAREAVKVLRPNGGTRTVAAVVAELRESKERRHERGDLRDRTWLDFKSRSAKVAEAFGTQPINLVTAGDLKTWLRRLSSEGLGSGKLGGRSVKNYRALLSELFSYAAQKEYCASNPLDRFTREDVRELGGQKSKRARINILTVEEAAALLATARSQPALGLLPSVILRLFCGLRTEETVRLDWHDVRWQDPEPYVHISEDKAKSRSARNVTIPPNALEWLALCPTKSGRVSPLTDSQAYCKRFRRLQRLAGFGKTDPETGKWRSTWETNDTRHSFGSYHFAKHGDSIKTSNEMGHSRGDAVLFNHYRRLTTKAEGERYFALRPGAENEVSANIAPFLAQEAG